MEQETKIGFHLEWVFFGQYLMFLGSFSLNFS